MGCRDWLAEAYPPGIIHSFCNTVVPFAGRLRCHYYLPTCLPALPALSLHIEGTETDGLFRINLSLERVIISYARTLYPVLSPCSSSPWEEEEATYPGRPSGPYRPSGVAATDLSACTHPSHHPGPCAAHRFSHPAPCRNAEGATSTSSCDHDHPFHYVRVVVIWIARQDCAESEMEVAVSGTEDALDHCR